MKFFDPNPTAMAELHALLDELPAIQKRLVERFIAATASPISSRSRAAQWS